MLLASRGHLCLYILNRVEIWTGVTDASLTHRLTEFERGSYSAPYEYKSEALVTQFSKYAKYAEPEKFAEYEKYAEYA